MDLTDPTERSDADVVEEPQRPLLEVEGLRTHFFGDQGVSKAVDGVSFELHSGEIVGVVGESGCGKSVTALSLIRLVQHPGRIVGGRVRLAGQDLLASSGREMRRLRGGRVAMIFQDPLTTLNPVIRVGEQIAESIRIHHGDGGLPFRGAERDAFRRNGSRFGRGGWRRRREDVWARGIEMMEQVGISAPDRRMREFPHQFSGGMRQRAMIAIALAANPTLLLADEPTTALDVTIQAQVLELMLEIRRKFGMSILLITHDFGVVSEVCDRVIVMYAGKVAETATVDELLDSPAHPYTRGLLASIPRLEDRTRRIEPIEGSVPDLINPPEGCRFAARCPLADQYCYEVEPELRVNQGHAVACHKA